MKKKEIQIALVAIIGIVILYFGLQFLKGLTIFSNDKNYYVKFNDISGLSASSPVYANGFRVGVVEDIIYNYDHQEEIVAVVGLNSQMRLPKGSSAEIASDLLGNIKINLVLGGDPLNMVAKGDTIPGGEQEGMMSKLGAMMPAIESIVPKLDSIMSSLNALLGDPALQNILHNVEGMTSQLNATSNELHTLSASLNRSVPGLMQKADGVLDNTHKLTANLSAIDVAGMEASINKTLADVNALTQRLNSNVYRNIESSAADLDSLLIDIKAHPKRYVHFSVFGKKDK